MLLPLIGSIWDMTIQKFGSPSYEDMQTRVPLFVIIDKDYRYKVTLEVLGIDKEKIKIKTKLDSAIVKDNKQKDSIS